MRRIVNSTFVSLDGVINHMDRWHFGFIDDELEALALDQMRASDALLLGRHTYDIYASAWPACDGERAFVLCWSRTGVRPPQPPGDGRPSANAS